MPVTMKRSAYPPPQHRPSSKRKRKADVKTTQDESGAGVSSSSEQDDHSQIELLRANGLEHPLLAAGTRTNDWVAAFRKVIQKKEQEIAVKLNARRAEIVARNSVFQREVIPVLQEALRPLANDEASEDDGDDEDGKGDPRLRAPSPPPPASTLLSTSYISLSHKHYASNISKIMEHADNLLKDFNSLCESEASTCSISNTVQQSSLRLRDDLEKDHNAARAMIAAGRKVALADVEAMLADRSHEVRGGDKLTREEERKGRMLMNKGREADKSEKEEEEGQHRLDSDMVDTASGWGNVAYEAQRAMKGLSQVDGIL